MPADQSTPEPQGSTDAARRQTTATQQLTDQDHKLIAAFFDPDESLVAIARDHNLKVAALAVWSRQPHIREILESIAELAGFRAKVLSAERAALAVRTLDHCATQIFAGDMADPKTRAGTRTARLESARRAAVAILRHAGPTSSQRPPDGASHRRPTSPSTSSRSNEPPTEDDAKPITPANPTDAPTNKPCLPLRLRASAAKESPTQQPFRENTSIQRSSKHQQPGPT